MSERITSWRPETEAPEGEWVIARTVKQPWRCTRAGEKPVSDEKQAVKIGGIWWVFKDSHGRELRRALFQWTTLHTDAPSYWPRPDRGTLSAVPDEWLPIPPGVLPAPRELKVLNAETA